jgi:asparagine synthase (glutamine-hydrolysing)
MCAINGCNVKDEALVERMNAATRHRGPDATRIVSDRNLITLGFNRLAIIDLSEKAMQPMRDASGRFTIVFNGEIYNFKELKKELSEYPFQSESDTEVILAAWNRWGEAACSKLNGMFAFALWDKEEESLFLARDSAGVKPLYYYFDGTRLIFSSEIKGLLEAEIPRVINQEALHHYLRLMYVPAPLTMFQGVSKLLPGRLLKLAGSKLTIEEFRGAWQGIEAPQGEEEAAKLLRSTVHDAVARQMVSDRPIGLYLSGGVDSSVLASIASKIHPRIDTYSVGYDLEEGEEHEKFNADKELAKRTAAYFGTTHHEYDLSSEGALSLFKETVRYLDEPIGNATSISQMYLAREVKETATVVLSGDGGDELFGGYERYRLAHLAHMTSKFGGSALSVIPQLKKLGYTGVDRYEQLMFQKDSVAKILRGETNASDTKKVFEQYFSDSSEDIVTALMRADEHTWLVDEALMRADKMGMAGSVEVRVPFLDLDVRHFAHSLSRRHKVTVGSTKRLLKHAFRHDLPQEVLLEPKRGWFSPGAKWLRRDDFVEFAERVFSEEYAGSMSALIDLEEVKRLWMLHRDRKEYHYTILFAVLVFLTWAHEYKVSI